MKVLVSKMYLEEQPYYIYCDGEIFQLRLKENHYVVATSLSEADLLGKVKLLFQKYNTPVTLEEVLRNTDMRLSDSERNRRMKQFEEDGMKYEEIIHDIIKELTHYDLGKKKVIKKKKVKFKLKSNK